MSRPTSGMFYSLRIHCRLHATRSVSLDRSESPRAKVAWQELISRGRLILIALFVNKRGNHRTRNISKKHQDVFAPRGRSQVTWKATFSLSVSMWFAVIRSSAVLLLRAHSRLKYWTLRASIRVPIGSPLSHSNHRNFAHLVQWSKRRFSDDVVISCGERTSSRNASLWFKLQEPSTRIPQTANDGSWVAPRPVGDTCDSDQIPAENPVDESHAP